MEPSSSTVSDEKIYYAPYRTTMIGNWCKCCGKDVPKSLMKFKIINPKVSYLLGWYYCPECENNVEFSYEKYCEMKSLLSMEIFGYTKDDTFKIPRSDGTFSEIKLINNIFRFSTSQKQFVITIIWDVESVSYDKSVILSEFLKHNPPKIDFDIDIIATKLNKLEYTHYMSKEMINDLCYIFSLFKK